AVVELDPLLEPAERFVARLPDDLSLVDLFDLVARVCKPVGEVAVVRKQQRPGRVGIEPADRDDSDREVRDELDDGWPAVWIARRGDDARRLVAQYVGERLARQR